MKLKKKKIIIISIIVFIFLLLIFFVGKIIADTNRNPYGNRCDERHNLPISDSQLKKVKKRILRDYRKFTKQTGLCDEVSERLKRFNEFSSKNPLSVWEIPSPP